MLNFFHIFILSVVEGLTEFLPISSTGHLIIANHFLGLEANNFLSTFEIFIQLGAICAIVFLYWKKILFTKKLLLKVLVSFLPTALVGLIFYPVIKGFLLKSNLVVVISLFVGGVILILFEWWYKKEEKPVLANVEEVKWQQALLIGIGQAFAVIPGVSRSGATIVTGLWLGLSRSVIVEFSFMLAIPTMFAASSYDLFKQGLSFNLLEIKYLLVGFVLSFFLALFVAKWLLNYVKDHNFIVFGIYRIILALVLWLVIF